MRSESLNSSWALPPSVDPGLVERLSEKSGVIPEVAAVLLRRAGQDIQKALSFLPGHERARLLPEDLCGLPGMRDAVRRLIRARQEDERVVVYGDFDCDGVTGAAVLREALEHAGYANVKVYFPSRTLEGYGFHERSAVELAQEGATLFITVDCGISGGDACRRLSQLGTDVIVTDHHLPPAVLPEATAVIDPHLPSWRAMGLDHLTGLTGAGVAYLLSTTLLMKLGVEVHPAWAHDLLALSIAADAQPVTGQNREWIWSGIESIEESPRPGIHALLRVSGLRREEGDRGLRHLTFDRDLTFGLVPRINAAGRLADPRLALDLLCTHDHGEALELARELDKLNQERRELEERMLEECRGVLPEDRYALCAFRPGWHEGVIGIVSSRVREMYKRPAVLVGGEGEVLKGSVRGISGFNVVRALEHCGGLLDAFGGHEGAGGFSVQRSVVEEFFERFDRVTALMLEQSRPHEDIPVDEVLQMGRVTDDTLEAFLRLEPFGPGNPLPEVACMDLEIVQMGLMGSSLSHLQMVLTGDGVNRRFIWFGHGKQAREIALWGRVDALFVPYRSTYRGQTQLSPLLRDVRPSWKVTGLPFAGLAKQTPKGRPVILYTWSDDAAESLWVALRKEGMLSWLHRRGQSGVHAIGPRAVLREGGTVVSTTPWELGLKEGPDVELIMVHRPIFGDDLRMLRAFSSGAGVMSRALPSWRQDGLKWLAWRYPGKDPMRALWNFLTRDYPGGRIPLWNLGCRWDEILGFAGFDPVEASLEGGRLFIGSVLRIFEDVGLVRYDEARRVPELVVRKSGGKVDLEDSPAYVAGALAKSAADEAWQDEALR